MRLGMQQKYWIFLILVIVAGLYIFEPTSQTYYVKSFVEFKLDFAPLFSIKNIMSILLFYMGYKIFVAGQ